MLDEAVEVIRKLWTGDTVDQRGDFYAVENARLFDPPPAPPPVELPPFGRTGEAH
jgi:alkanesulfonate monooxygenase SsuD/methylene tetrahydromethanopterin reductase-like flavin-dependent oxidoreductase (luciferase family)